MLVCALFLWATMFGQENPAPGSGVKDRVNELGKNGSRYVAAENFEVAGLEVFGNQPRYDVTKPETLNGWQLTTAGQLGLDKVDGWNEVDGFAAKVRLNPNEPVRYLGNMFYLDNCQWYIGGKWVAFKNRFRPIVPPTPDAPVVQVVELKLTPAPAEVALVALPPALSMPVAPTPVVFQPEKRHKFPIPCFPREKGWYGIGLPVVSCAGLVFGGLGAAGFWSNTLTKLPGIPAGAGILP